METMEATTNNRLRAERTRRGLAQSDLAAAAGLTQAAVSQLETGRNSPTLRTARALAAALGVASIDSLFPAETHDQERAATA